MTTRNKLFWTRLKIHQVNKKSRENQVCDTLFVDYTNSLLITIWLQKSTGKKIIKESLIGIMYSGIILYRECILLLDI